MHSVTDSTNSAAAIDALLIARIAALRESVRGHKQRALAMWDACLPTEKPSGQRVSHGKFTQQLVNCE